MLKKRKKKKKDSPVTVKSSHRARNFLWGALWLLLKKLPLIYADHVWQSAFLLIIIINKWDKVTSHAGSISPLPYPLGSPGSSAAAHRGSMPSALSMKSYLWHLARCFDCTPTAKPNEGPSENAFTNTGSTKHQTGPVVHFPSSYLSFSSPLLQCNSQTKQFK